MRTKTDSRLANVIKALRILEPIAFNDPIDSETMADFLELSPEQVSPCLSVLHYTGYLTRVGTRQRFALYIRTRKPLPKRSASIERRYRHGLQSKSRNDYTTSHKRIASEVSRAVITALRKELRPRSSPPIIGNSLRQLTLFNNA
jgi:hypothetical protein